MEHAFLINASTTQATQLQSNTEDMENLIKNMSEEELYKCFFPENNNATNATETENLNPPSNSIEWNPSELNFPDLSLLDLQSDYLTTSTTQPDILLPLNVTVKQEFPEAHKDARKRTQSRNTDTTNVKRPRLNTQVIVKDEKKFVKGVDDKYKKRLQANKKSAQASRERKKQLKTELEIQVNYLVEENSSLGTQITELETENKVLKNEFLQLQRLISDSAILSKLMARANMSLMPPVPETPVKPSSTAQIAAWWYLMIVLYSFNHYWKTSDNFSTDFPFTVTPNVASVA